MTAPHRPVRYAVTALSAIYALVLYAVGIRLDGSVKQLLAYLPTAAVIGVVAFDLWIWRLPAVHRLVRRPRIDGAWLTTLTPHPDSRIPEGGNRGPIDAAVLIEQTYWSVHVTLLTAESRSMSTSAELNCITRQQASLTYTYANEPDQQHRPRSQPHAGASQFNVTGRTPSHMAGNYWTARLTAGDMTMRLVNRRTDYPSLADVQAAASASASDH